MALQNQFERYSFVNRGMPLRLEGLCEELNRSAQMQLERVLAAIASFAPRPGVLMHVRTHKLAVRMDGFEPVVFSAIDASTLLQVAQVYLMSTTAAALSFVEFMNQSFPFSVTHIKTTDEKPFVNASGPEPHRDFSSIVEHMGLTHSVISAPSHDTLFMLTSKLTFGGISEGLIANTTEAEMQKELAHFLFFHNNYRSVPWLGGKTPVQKLGTFSEIAPLDAFDPYAATVPNFHHF
jgi:hypothetical protein